MSTPTGNWIFMLNRGATEEQTAAFADKINELGREKGFKVLDHSHGTVLVQSDEAFARQIEKQFASELRLVTPEVGYERPDTRPHIRKPPNPFTPPGPGGPK